MTDNIIFEKSQFNSLVWGSFMLAQLSIVVVVYPDRSLTYECLTVVSRKYAPPFVILALVQSVGGGLYAGCNIFSCDYALPRSRNVLVLLRMLVSFSHCHSTMETLNLTV